MMGNKAAIGAHEAVLQMDCKLVLAAALLSALWTSDTEIAVLIVLVELRLAGEDALAAFALEMIQLVMRPKCSSIGAIKATAGFQAVLVCCIDCKYELMYVQCWRGLPLPAVFFQCASRSSWLRKGRWHVSHQMCFLAVCKCLTISW
jgi:hypothetical protein